jgi:hypothetical protein
VPAIVFIYNEENKIIEIDNAKQLNGAVKLMFKKEFGVV